MKRFYLNQTFVVKLVALMVCLSSWTAQAATDYAIHDLGTLMREGSLPTEINNSNIILGITLEKGKDVKFIWEAGKDLLYIDDKLAKYLPKINNTNTIAGIFWIKSFAWFSSEVVNKHIVLFTIDGSKREDIGVPSDWEIKGLQDWQTPYAWDGKDLGLIDYNDKGQLLVSNASELSKATKFVLWNNGKFTSIDSRDLSMAYQINNHGLILGRKWVKENGNDVPMLVVYNFENGETFEIMRDINLIEKRLNDRGEVVITKKVQENHMEGFIWDVEQGLHSLDNFCPVARNNKNQMVGSYNGAMYLWDNGELHNLNEELDVGRVDSLWNQIVLITGINDNGWIIGQGVFDEKKHAFVLVPLKD